MPGPLLTLVTEKSLIELFQTRLNTSNPIFVQFEVSALATVMSILSIRRTVTSELHLRGDSISDSNVLTWSRAKVVSNSTQVPSQAYHTGIYLC